MGSGQMILRGAGGFGDSIYMYPVLKYFLKKGETVEILTKYPDIYAPLRKLGLIISDRYSKAPDTECRYAPRYSIQVTTTYQDTLILSGAPPSLPFTIEFEHPKEFAFSTNKKICVIRKPTMPMKGKSGGDILIPDCSIIQRLIDKYRNDYYFVLAGNPEGEFNFPLRGIDLDLTEKLTIPEVLQLAFQSDMIITQCGFFIPICETLNRRCFILFSDKGMKSNYKFSPHITPRKVINNYSAVNFAIDNEPFANIDAKFSELAKRKISC
jgi:hypothetical protein